MPRARYTCPVPTLIQALVLNALDVPRTETLYQLSAWSRPPPGAVPGRAAQDGDLPHGGPDPALASRPALGAYQGGPRPDRRTCRRRSRSEIGADLARRRASSRTSSLAFW